MNERLFITGATSKTGIAFLLKLSERGLLEKSRVTCLVRNKSSAEKLSPFDVTIVTGDATSTEELGKAYSGEDTVVHISSIFHTPHLLPAINGAKKLIAVSSTRIYSRHYSRAQDIAQCERMIEESGIPYTIIRPTMIYGTPDDRNISRLVRLVSRSPLIPVPTGTGSTLQPVHVSDVATALVEAIERESARGKAFDIAGGSAISPAEMIKIIAKALDKRVALIPVPYFLLRAISAAIQILPGRQPIAEAIMRLSEDKSVDIEPARRELSLNPITFEEGVLNLIKEMQAGPTT